MQLEKNGAASAWRDFRRALATRASCAGKTSEAARGAASLYIKRPQSGRGPLRHQASAFKTASPMPAVVTFVVPGSKMSAVRRPLASTLRTAASMRSACGARFSE